MAFNCVAIDVMLSGPGDVARPLSVIEQLLYTWNRERAKTSSAVLLPRHWSTDAHSSFSLGSDGQAEINQQLVDGIDIVFAVFHARLGTSTPRAVSGTAEEIEKAIDDGTKVHVFFCKEPIPVDHDSNQLAALNTFKEALAGRGLFQEFRTDDDLRGLVRMCLEADVNAVNAPSPLSSDVREAELAVRFDYREVTETDTKGKVKTRRKGEKLVVRNNGKRPAHDVTVIVEPIGSGDPVHMHTEDGKTPHFETIAPGTEVSVPVALFLGAALQQRATIHWTESGEQREFSHTLTFS